MFCKIGLYEHLNPNGSICTTCFKILKLRILPSYSISVFDIVLAINSDGFANIISRLMFVAEA
jgi:hypothetical protein